MTEIEARHMLPGDMFRHDGQLCRVRHILINCDEVTIEADIMLNGKIRAGTTLERKPTDPLRIVADPAASPPRQPKLIDA